MPEAAPSNERPQWFYRFYNPLGLTGLVIIALAGTMVLLVALLDWLAPAQRSYVGLAYVGGALIVAVGALVALLGALTDARWRRKHPDRKLSLYVDLEVPKHRWIFVALAATVVVVTGLLAMGSYETVHYVESNQFCTSSCHTVMGPEGVAHQQSPHSQIDCVTCHVGDGAAPFLESKLAGFGQLLALWTDSYERPIPTPIHRMRPARETCEQCHSRKRWIGFKEIIHTYYKADDDNTPDTLRLLLKLGGARSGLVPGEGIHYHMVLGRQVQFIARDKRKQDIAWLKVTERDGKVREFNNGVKPLTKEERATLPVHEMDCMDCHNRPAHKFLGPTRLLNRALRDGSIDRRLPGIKRKGVELLSAEYESTDEALASIDTELRAFYAKEHPEVEANRVAAAAEALQETYRHDFFPEMKVRWSAYPDNLEHRDWPGCFRCHNEDMVDAEGNAVFTTCTKCHVVLAQTASNNGSPHTDFEEGQAFYHVDDEDTLDEYTDCVACHDGGDGAY
jgi:hypothetical protein